MRDIRIDLRERLDAVTSQQSALQEQIAALENQKKLLTELLRDEQQRWERRQQQQMPLGGLNGTGDLVDRQNGSSIELKDIVSELLGTGEPWYSSQLASIAQKRGYSFGERSPGRAVHFTLLAMANRGEIENVGEGLWRKKSELEAR